MDLTKNSGAAVTPFERRHESPHKRNSRALKLVPTSRRPIRATTNVRDFPRRAARLSEVIPFHEERVLRARLPNGRATSAHNASLVLSSGAQ